MLCLVIIAPLGRRLETAAELTTTKGNDAQDGCTLHKTISSAALLTSFPGNDLKWQIASNSLERSSKPMK